MHQSALCLNANYVDALSFEFPQAYNYAGQGGTAGHELVHGFDDQGKLILFLHSGDVNNTCWTFQEYSSVPTEALAIALGSNADGWKRSPRMGSVIWHNVLLRNTGWLFSEETYLLGAGALLGKKGGAAIVRLVRSKASFRLQYQLFLTSFQLFQHILYLREWWTSWI